MSALRQMFSLPLASGSLGARGRRVGGGDLWLRELSLGLSARGLQRSSVPTHSLQILRSTFGLSTSSLGTAGSRLRGASLLPKGFRRGSLIALAHQNGPGTGGEGSPLPGRAPCPYRIQKGRRWRSSPDFRTQPIGRGAGFSVLSDTCFFFFFLNDSHYGILNFLWGWGGMAGKHSPHLFGFILPSQL